MIGDYNQDNVTKLLPDGSNRGFITDTSYLSLMLYYTNGTFKYTQLQENIISDHFGFQFAVNNFIYNAFNRKVVQLVEAGIADRNIKDFCSQCAPKEETSDPLILTHEHLGIWFLVWLGCLLLCFMCFLVEVAMPRKMQKLKSMLQSRSFGIQSQKLKKNMINKGRKLALNSIIRFKNLV